MIQEFIPRSLPSPEHLGVLLHLGHVSDGTEERTAGRVEDVEERVAWVVGCIKGHVGRHEGEHLLIALLANEVDQLNKLLVLSLFSMKKERARRERKEVPGRKW